MRREKRTQVDEAARLHPNSWSSMEARVLDISPRGFMAACSARVMIGGPVSVEIPGMGRLNAHVTWRRGDKFGARFDTQIDLAQLPWEPVGDQGELGRLLVQRVEAREAGEVGHELELRRKILAGLPVLAVKGAEPARRGSSA